MEKMQLNKSPPICAMVSHFRNKDQLDLVHFSSPGTVLIKGFEVEKKNLCDLGQQKWMSLSESDYSSKGYIVFLGKFYAAEGSDTVVGLNFVDFCRDYYTRLWITYRTGMPPLLDSEVTSDCGWGCMIRTTQMAFAQAIVTNRLGRGWRYFGPKPKLLRDESLPHIEGDPLYNSQIDIIKLFEDMPSAPLGIHRLLEIFVNEYDENPIGKWYTPSQVIFLFKSLMILHSRKALRTSASPLTCDLSLMLANDGRVIVDDAERECHYWSKRLLLFIPLRLGTNVVNPIYTDHICQLLSQKTCLGLLGGRPDHSLYFIGYYDNHVIYLDPHVAQEYAPISMWEDLSSCKGITEEEKVCCRHYCVAHIEDDLQKVAFSFAKNASQAKNYT
ncbi:unnamed protein product [Nippostrongylus brasiliensis]|uniref:Cysteine protease n=1 Tax=Nippostrongylus brasiliensis TaxID=27835 RepID=A0A0N4YZ34_NIPBR|nr:unnamed protein product [Nippostrongylus brasiliensis]